MVKSNSPFTLIAIEEHFLTEEVLHTWYRAELRSETDDTGEPS